MKKMSKSDNRRNFIKKGLAGLAGLTFIPGTIKSAKRNSYHPGDKPFIYRTLGKTGISLPVISMGVMNSNNPNLVKAALDAGIIHFDTAWYYQMGRNEEMVGRVIKNKRKFIEKSYVNEILASFNSGPLFSWKNGVTI